MYLALGYISYVFRYFDVQLLLLLKNLTMLLYFDLPIPVTVCCNCHWYRITSTFNQQLKLGINTDN